jgi:UMF1 family MFS transporter
LSSRVGIRRSIQLNLVIWVGIAVAAFFLPEGQFPPFLATGVAIGLVLGGIQALSRSLYGSMIPESASAEFYGFYSVFSKFSAIWGPLLFAIISTQGNSRYGILSVILFFVVGLALFSRVDIDRARASKDEWQLSEA